jgi:hypothetical protein
MKTLLIVVISFIVSFFSLFLVFQCLSPFTAEEKFDEIEYNIQNLPDSYVKRNLMLTIAGEYGGYSEELYSLLKPFSEMTLKEMTK